MAFALVFIGLLMIVTGANNTYQQFGSQLKSDFTGNKSFVLYVAALGGVGAVGYVTAFRTFSHYFMALILISLVLSNKGFFTNLSAALNASPVAPQAGPTPGETTNPTGQGFLLDKPLLDLGPLGTINPSITPGSITSSIFKFFGGTTK